MSREIRFGVRITGDSRDVRQSMRRTDQDVRRFRREMRQTQTQARATTGAMNTWAGSLRALRSTVGPLIGITGVGGLARLTQQAIANTAAIQDSADVAGIGAQQYQELTKGLSDLGNVAESVTEGALRRFNRRFGQARQGTGQARDALEELEVSLDQGTGPALDAAVRRLAEIDDSSDRAALASDLFGETAGPQLAAALDQGSEALATVIEQLRESNRIMSQDSIDSATRLDRRWREFTDSFRSNTQQMVLGLVEFSESLEDIGDIPGLGGTPFALRGNLESLRDTLTQDPLDQEIEQTITRIERLDDAMESGVEMHGLEESIREEKELLELLERRREIQNDLASGTRVPEVRRHAGLETEDFTGGRPDMESVDLTGDQQRERDQRQNELLREKERLLRSIQTPQEEYGEQVAMLQRLHQAGEIDQEQFNRGLEQAEQNLKQATRETDNYAQAGRRLQMTFQSALEDSIVDFENWRNVAASALQDVQRIMLRQTVTGPLTDTLGDAFAGGGGSGSQGVGGATPRTFAGGGYTGNAPRSGGVDGIGGFPAILHPRETVIDHTRGGVGDSITFSPVIQVSGDGADTEAKIDRALRRAYPEFERRIAERQARRGRSRL